MTSLIKDQNLLLIQKFVSRVKFFGTVPNLWLYLIKFQSDRFRNLVTSGKNFMASVLISGHSGLYNPVSLSSPVNDVERVAVVDGRQNLFHQQPSSFLREPDLEETQKSSQKRGKKP